MAWGSGFVCCLQICVGFDFGSKVRDKGYPHLTRVRSTVETAHDPKQIVHFPFHGTLVTLGRVEGLG